jgi:hypothetical protein
VYFGCQSPFVLFGVLLGLAWVAMRKEDEVLKYEQGKTTIESQPLRSLSVSSVQAAE